MNKHYQARFQLVLETLCSKEEVKIMQVKNKTANFVDIRLSSDEYDAFVQILKLQRKDYKGGK